MWISTWTFTILFYKQNLLCKLISTTCFKLFYIIYKFILPLILYLWNTYNVDCCRRQYFPNNINIYKHKYIIIVHYYCYFNEIYFFFVWVRFIMENLLQSSTLILGHFYVNFIFIRSFSLGFLGHYDLVLHY